MCRVINIQSVKIKNISFPKEYKKKKKNSDKQSKCKMIKISNIKKNTRKGCFLKKPKL